MKFEQEIMMENSFIWQFLENIEIIGNQGLQKSS